MKLVRLSLWFLLLPACVLALVVAGSQLRAVANDESAPPATKPAAPADEPAADVAADSFALPADADEAKLIEFMEATAKRRPSGNTQEEMISNYVHTMRAVIAAADKVLAGNPNDEVRVKAVQYKLQALANLGRTGDEAALQDFVTFATSLENDKSPELAKLGRMFALQGKIATIPATGTDEQIKQLVDEVTEMVKTAQADRESLRFGMNLAQQLEINGKAEQAVATYESLAKLVGESDDPEVRAYASKLEGSARRVGLLGKPIELNGTLVDGKPFDWGSYAGKVVLIDFWATWCGPCLGELPNVKANYERFHDKGFEVVGISLDDATPEAKAALETFLKDNQIPWSNIYSSDETAGGWENPIATRYGISSIPATMLVDRDGKVISLSARGEELTHQLEKLLGDEPTKVSELQK